MVTLERMRWWHVAELLPLERELFAPEGWSERLFWSELGQLDTRHYVVALDGEQVVGWAGLCDYPDEAWVQTIAVAPAARGTGLADRLLEDLLAEAGRRRQTAVSLEVRADNLPLSMWSNRWSTMPVPSMPRLRLPRPDRRATLAYMPGSDVPVLRQPFELGDRLPYWCMGQPANAHALYDLSVDPEERENRAGEPVERRMLDLLHAALTVMNAPEDQFERLGISASSTSR